MNIGKDYIYIIPLSVSRGIRIFSVHLPVKVYQGDNIGGKAYTSLKRVIHPGSLSQNKDITATRVSSPMLTLTSDK